jgi:hypothetical protein
LQTELQVSRVYFISINFSALRRGRWDAVRCANALIEDFARARDGVAFIDTTKVMLDRSGEPRRKLLRWDRSHLSAEGYAVWTSVIKPLLEHDFQIAA